MDEKKWNISTDNTGQQLGVMSYGCFCRHSYQFKLKMEHFFSFKNNTKHNLTIGFIKSLVRQNFVRSDKI